MRILEPSQAFLSLLTIEFFFLLVRGKPQKSQNSNKVKNGCTNSRVRIENEYPSLNKLST